MELYSKLGHRHQKFQDTNQKVERILILSLMQVMVMIALILPFYFDILLYNTS